MRPIRPDSPIDRRRARLARVCPRLRAISLCVAGIAGILGIAAPARADLEISPGVTKRHFGAAMAFAESDLVKFLAIGGPGASGGRVHVFRSVDLADWELDATLSTNIVATNPSFAFGASLAMRSDSDGSVLLVVGAPLVDQSRGEAFIFRRSVAGSWNLHQSVRHPAAQPNDRFGTSVAISPDLARIAIGASKDNTQGPGSSSNDARGSVLVLRREQDDYIFASFASAAIPGDGLENIGTAIAFGHAGGQTPELLVGAPRGRNSSGSPTGKIHVLREKPNRSWQLVKSIVPTVAGVQIAGWGASISATPTRAAVGAPNSTIVVSGVGVVSNAGAAFTLKKVSGNWSVDAPLVRSNPLALPSFFGSSVAIDGTAVVVGSQEERAYLFRRDNTGAWRQLDTLQHAGGSQPKPNERFGGTVAIGAGTMAASCMLRDLGSTPQNGSVVLYEVVPTKFFSTQPTRLGRFGTSCAISGSRAVVGSPRDLIESPIAGNLGDGLIRIMRRSNGVWVPEFTLNAFQRGIRYGNAVAMPNDTTVIVGASDRSAFEIVQEVAAGLWARRGQVFSVNGPGAPSDRLGSSVAGVDEGDGIVAASGGPSAPGPGTNFNSGRVIFAATGSSISPDMLVNPSPADGDRFGSGLAMQRYADGTIDLWVVAAEADTAVGAGTGALYLYRRGPGEINFRLIEADVTLPGMDAGSGLSVQPTTIAMKGRTLVVSTYDPTGAGPGVDSGTVHVLRRSPTGGWARIAGTLVVEDLAGFPLSVATNGGRIIVGVPGQDRAIIARVAGQDLIEEGVSLQPDPDSTGGAYGLSVAIGPGTQPAIVVGAPNDRLGDLLLAGSAYGFSGSWDACAADLDSSGTVDLVDLSLLLSFWGTPGLVDGEPSADLDADGLVKSSDMQRLLLSWGGCSE